MVWISGVNIHYTIVTIVPVAEFLNCKLVDVVFPRQTAVTSKTGGIVIPIRCIMQLFIQFSYPLLGLLILLYKRLYHKE